MIWQHEWILIHFVPYGDLYKTLTVAPKSPKAENWEALGQAQALPGLHFLTSKVEMGPAEPVSYGPCFEADKRHKITFTCACSCNFSGLLQCKWYMALAKFKLYNMLI